MTGRRVVFERFTRGGSRVNAALARGALEEPLVEEVLPEQPPWEAPIALFARIDCLA